MKAFCHFRFQVSSLILCLFLAVSGRADSNTWTFGTPSDYSYDASKVQITGGIARLIPLDQTDNDNAVSGFGGGVSIGAQWNSTNNWLELNAAGRASGSGVFTSRVIAVGATAAWNSIAWSPQRLYGEELPGSGSVESGYPTGNVSMSGNMLLLHMSETGGTLADASGQGNSATATGAVLYSVSGRYGMALNFDGSNGFLTVSNPAAAGLNVTNCTLEAWLNTAGLDGSNVKGTDNGAALARHQGGTQVNGYELGLNSDEQPYFAYEDVATQNWVKYDNTMGVYFSEAFPAGNGRLPLGTLGDDNGVIYPAIIKEGGLYRMWYSGADGVNWRMYYATSSNGVDWTKGNTQVPTNSDGACTDGRVPLGSAVSGDDVHIQSASVLKDDDGTYKTWYSGYDGSFWRIFMATSPDGLTWSKVDNSTPVVSDGASTGGRIPLGNNTRGDDAGTIYPFVMKDGGVYKMWYGGSDGAIWRIYHATSPDGLNWTKTDNTIPGPADSGTASSNGRVPVGNNTRGDDAYVISGYVVKTGGVYQMWYTGSDGANNRIFHATSPDGLAWTKTDNTTPAASDVSSSNGRVPIAATAGRGDITHAGYCGILQDDDGTYKMWYAGYLAPNWRIFYATSPDGLAWTKVDNTVPVTGDNLGMLKPSVIKDGGVYKMWYMGSGANWRTFYATSTNGLTWQKFNNANVVTTSDGLCTNGIILLGSAGRGDQTGIYGHSVLKEGGLYRMWYSGYDGTYMYIFYATSTDGVSWVKYDNTIPPVSDASSSNGRVPRGSAGRADSFRAYYHSVMKEGNTYHMWYTAYNNANDRICYASSPDGLTWTKVDNTVPTSSDVTGTNGCIPLGVTGADLGGVRLPCVMRDGDLFKMWYAGYVAPSYRTYMASSPDGLTWTKYDNSIPALSDTTGTRGRIPVGSAGRIDETYASSGSVLKDGAVYKMWYTTYGAVPLVYRIAYATMTVGLTASNAVSTGAWHHLVGTVDNGTTCLYVDGVLAATGATAVASVTNSAALRIGDMFNGALDELAIYNRALTADEVRDRYLR
ncbi:MAG: hypothetical protein HY343_10825, partial [Lentisphaerae bacterium]|nr:hypothetical protein [Lentisphaerota bacterium]